ncbi:MAG: DNA polymerase IV [Actinomycetota bacterium]
MLFFASVEIRDNPALRGKAVVVAGGSRGVVLSASYEARKFGIHAAMPAGRARKMAPHAIFVYPTHNRYGAISRKIMEIFATYTPLVEPISVDEAFLDVTGSRKLIGTGPEIATRIRADVYAQEGITCSVGIATTKFIAKLASQSCKPNGMLEIDPAKVLDFLHPLPVSAVWGVGPKTNEVLQRLGLRTVGDIANTPRQTLIKNLGEASGVHLYELAWGRDYRPVTLDEPDKSISAVETFPWDLVKEEEILRELLRLTEKASGRLRARSMSAQVISLKVRFADFKTISRSKTVPLPINGIQECYEVAKKLYQALKLDRVQIRLIGIGLESLVDSTGTPVQLTLGERESGWREATKAVDQASVRFGKGSVRPARLLKPLREEQSEG